MVGKVHHQRPGRRHERTWRQIEQDLPQLRSIADGSASASRTQRCQFRPAPHARSRIAPDPGLAHPHLRKVQENSLAPPLRYCINNQFHYRCHFCFEQGELVHVCMTGTARVTWRSYLFTCEGLERTDRTASQGVPPGSHCRRPLLSAANKAWFDRGLEPPRGHLRVDNI